MSGTLMDPVSGKRSSTRLAGLLLVVAAIGFAFVLRQRAPTAQQGGTVDRA